MLSLSKKIQATALSVAVISGLGIGAAFAQNATGATAAPASPGIEKSDKAWGGGHHKGGHKGGKRCGAFKELNLTEYQKAKMKAQGEAFHKENASAFASLKAKHEQLKGLGKDAANEAQRKQLMSEIRSERQALMAKRKGTMKGILTPEQMGKLETVKAQCKAEHMKHRQDKLQDKTQ